MNKDPEITKFFSLIEEKNSFSICLPENPSLDALMSGTALYTLLADLGKQVTLACSTPVNEFGHYFGVEKVTSQLISDGNSLLISIPYTNSGIDSVNYYIENDRLYVSVTPDQASARINSDQVKFSYTSGDVDVFIALDSPRLEVLGGLYNQNKTKFEKSRIVNIDRRFNNALYGEINIIEKDAASLSEMITRLLKSFNRQPTKEIATNLYAGILQATNTFSSYSVSSETLEAAAYLLKHNAQKKVTPPVSTAHAVKTVQTVELEQKLVPESSAQVPQITTDIVAPQVELQQQPQQAKNSEIPTEVPSPMDASTSQTSESPTQTPTDWLRPKIFSGQRTAQ